MHEAPSADDSSSEAGRSASLGPPLKKGFTLDASSRPKGVPVDEDAGAGSLPKEKPLEGPAWGASPEGFPKGKEVAAAPMPAGERELAEPNPLEAAELSGDLARAAKPPEEAPPPKAGAPDPEPKIAPKEGAADPKPKEGTDDPDPKAGTADPEPNTGADDPEPSTEGDPKADGARKGPAVEEAPGGTGEAAAAKQSAVWTVGTAPGRSRSPRSWGPSVRRPNDPCGSSILSRTCGVADPSVAARRSAVLAVAAVPPSPPHPQVRTAAKPHGKVNSSSSSDTGHVIALPSCGSMIDHSPHGWWCC